MTETWMVAHDFSPCSDAAAFEAARLVAPLKGTVRLFHVHAPMQLPPQAQWGDETFALENELRRKLERLAQSMKEAHPGVTVELDVASGEPVSGILEEAARIGAGHIVVGTHGRSGLAHLLLGSVAERVVKEAKVPVLVVRTPEHA